MNEILEIKWIKLLYTTIRLRKRGIEMGPHIVPNPFSICNKSILRNLNLKRLAGTIPKGPKL